jgi:hypothetical protein
MADYNSELKDWGATGSDWIDGYSYAEGESPVDEWDNKAMSQIITEIKEIFNHLESLDNTASGKADNPHGNGQHIDPFVKKVDFDPGTDLHDRPVAGNLLTEDGSNNFNVDETALVNSFATNPHGNSQHTADYLTELNIEDALVEFDLSPYATLSGDPDKIDSFGVQKAFTDYNNGEISYDKVQIVASFWYSGKSIPSDNKVNVNLTIQTPGGTAIVDGLTKARQGRPITIMSPLQVDGGLEFKDDSQNTIAKLHPNGDLDVAGTVTENVNF